MGILEPDRKPGCCKMPLQVMRSATAFALSIGDPWHGWLLFLSLPGYGTVSPEAGHPRGNKLLLLFTLVHHCQQP